ncbi:ETEC_3214 domain-containing protein [Vibrio splendidus]|uniref:ETEC_3214 domain-containing protein n=1 Tax=Vibrio splendidus TaxID=29497 RepID=UPI00148E070B|nr:ETEC_3214 domain-containing protein [Vibrio splendidus]
MSEQALPSSVDKAAPEEDMSLTQQAPNEDQKDFLEIMREKTPNSILAIIALIIAGGQFNDAIDMGSKGWDLLISNFSDAPSNERLSKVYIRASSGILEETFGSPVYTKMSNGEVQIKYYKDSKFILSAITSNDTIDAFLIFPKPGFVADVNYHAGSATYLETNFVNSTAEQDAISNIARSGNYYIEEAEGGRYELLYSSVGGYSEYLSPLSAQQLKLLADFNDKLMMEENTKDSLTKLRREIRPNFYGYTTVDLESLAPAILTKLEYELITD